MRYNELIRHFRRQGFALQSYGRVKEGGKNYPLYKIFIAAGGRPPLLSKEGRGVVALLITSGFHGEEFNGPISLLKILPRLARRARDRGVNLLVYPCVNPSGFDARQRYNISGEEQNNDFLRYEVKKGVWAGTLKKGEKFLRYKLVASPAREARLLRADLRRAGLLGRQKPSAVLDIHQDDDLERGDFYAYIFDQPEIYEKIMRRLDKFAGRARDVTALNFEGHRKVRYMIDKNGFIFLHDGTLTDMFYRLGVPFVAAVETNQRLPFAQVVKINRLWAEALLDLVAT